MVQDRVQDRAPEVPPGRAPDVALLAEVLRGVEQAATALSGEVTEHEVASAREQLADLRERLALVVHDVAGGPPGRGRAAPAGRPPTDGGPAVVCGLLLDGDERPARAARSFCAATCASWSLPAAAASAVIDLASELASNAARHAGGALELVLERGAEHLLVTVSDASSEPPRVLPYRAGISERGIGLRLVDQLSESWGWSLVPEGKQVWARAALSDRPPASRRTSVPSQGVRRGP